MLLVRQPAVAGSFYPDHPEMLRALIEKLLAAQDNQACSKAMQAQAFIVPHAGYRYSGSVAAAAYRLIARFAAAYDAVLLVGAAHYVPFTGVALSQADAFRTPLGLVAVDESLTRKALTLPAAFLYPEAHAPEHSLEVQLPFLQMVLEEFKILPLLAGEIAVNDLAALLAALTTPRTLVLISSDLSHYLPDAEARKLDRSTLEAILTHSAGLTLKQACGATPINAWIEVAKRQGLKPELLAYRTSADAGGAQERVVGYASVAWFGEPAS